MPKLIVLALVIWIFPVSDVFAQALDLTKHNYTIDSTVRYRKTVVAYGMLDSDSLSGKTGIERLFFADFDAKVEYLLKPSFGPTFGLRIYATPNKDTPFCLEVKRVSNYKEINTQLKTEFPSKSTRIQDMMPLPKEEQDRILAYNDSIYDKWNEERLKRYRINTISIPIQDTLTEQLHRVMFELIRSAQAEGKFPGLVFDGETATFRCLSNNELWTVKFHVPEGDFKKLSDLCRAMITDAESGTFNEAKYMEELGKIGTD